MKWEDVTSYSRHEVKGKSVPRSWQLGKDHRAGIMVHRYHGVADAWFLTCYDLGIEQQALTNRELDKAKEEALGRAEQQLRKMIAYYKKLGIKP